MRLVLFTDIPDDDHRLQRLLVRLTKPRRKFSIGMYINAFPGCWMICTDYSQNALAAALIAIAEEHEHFILTTWDDSEAWLSPGTKGWIELTKTC